jgi:large subunit ribosomal protein L2
MYRLIVFFFLIPFFSFYVNFLKMALKYLKCRTQAFFSQKIIFLLSPSRKKELKTETRGLHLKGGRNHQGIITVKHKGSKGTKSLCRKIDSFSQLEAESFLIESLENDPNRNVKIARMFSAICERHFYSIATSSLEVGFLVKKNVLPTQKANIFGPLSNLPLGTLINSIGTDFRMFKGVLQRSAGTFAQIIQKGDFFCTVRLCSGQEVFFRPSTFASVGVVSNSRFQKISLGSAGRNRRKKKRPTVRGVAMNSNDHPHGGGEAKSTAGRPSVTP